MEAGVREIARSAGRGASDVRAKSGPDGSGRALQNLSDFNAAPDGAKRLGVRAVLCRFRFDFCPAVLLRRQLPRRRGEFVFEVHKFFDLDQKPAVDFGELKYFVHIHAGAEGMTDEKDAISIWRAELSGD